MPSNTFHDFLERISTKPLRVLDASISNSHYIPLDLSKHNTLLQSVDVSSSSKLEAFVNAHISKHNGLVAFGGYNEVRNIYQRSTHFNEQNPLTERNIHLGIDLWIAAGTEILSPLDGVVHSFKNNTNFGDYGPTIILKHVIDGVIFYTLYGHLSTASIEQLSVGQQFKQGEQLATLGDATVNGDYPPHLHFQIIKDIGEYVGDYPGVSSKQDLDYYLSNCPNPNVLLKLE